MKTFEYLDELIDSLMVLCDIREAILNWHNGEYPSQHNAYIDFIESCGFKEGCLEEDYIYWNLKFKFNKDSDIATPSSIENSKNKLKDLGYE